jgi:outer membrane protein insertion porin family
LGGNTLRGFQYAGVGPRDLNTDDSLGGNTFYRASAEFEFPVGLPDELGIKGHAFSDMGSLFSIDETGAGLADDSTIRAAAGVGISWASPMGPVRVDFATPLAEEDYDDTEKVRFNFGTRF